VLVDGFKDSHIFHPLWDDDFNFNRPMTYTFYHIFNYFQVETTDLATKL